MESLSKSDVSYLCHLHQPLLLVWSEVLKLRMVASLELAETISKLSPKRGDCKMKLESLYTQSVHIIIITVCVYILI